MGATQFCLLAALGLREHHSLLDFGCGSLRAGRFLIPYLGPGHYFGVEPNRWLVESAIEEDLGNYITDRYKPSFDYNSKFRFDTFGRRFDFIVMQSILSHTGCDLLELALQNARDAMSKKTRMIATIIHENGNPDLLRGQDFSGWRYPECVWYSEEEFRSIAESKDYLLQKLKWHHPRQTWWLLTLSKDALLDVSEVERYTGYPVQNEI